MKTGFLLLVQQEVCQDSLGFTNHPSVCVVSCLLTDSALCFAGYYHGFGLSSKVWLVYPDDLYGLYSKYGKYGKKSMYSKYGYHNEISVKACQTCHLCHRLRPSRSPCNRINQNHPYISRGTDYLHLDNDKNSPARCELPRAVDGSHGTLVVGGGGRGQYHAGKEFAMKPLLMIPSSAIAADLTTMIVFIPPPNPAGLYPSIR